MARTKSRSAATSPQSPTPQPRYSLDEKAEWGGFINIRVTEEQKELFEQWYASFETEIWSYVDDLLGEGMKVGMSYDAENEAYVVTFTGRLVGALQSRWTMTSRAGVLVEAVALATWKHHYLANGDYDDFKPKSGTFARWG